MSDGVRNLPSVPAALTFLAIEARDPETDERSRDTFEVEVVPESEREAQIVEFVTHAHPNARPTGWAQGVATFEDGRWLVVARYLTAVADRRAARSPRSQEQLFAA